MFGLKTDTYTLNTNGNGQYELFADISTRSLQSVLVGEGAGKISSGGGNAFVGFESGKQNLQGSFGVFVGFQAGAQNQNGNANTFVGAYAGKQNSRGDLNTFVGYQAGQLNANGSECTAVGVNALRETSTGNRNVAVGTRAGERIQDGDNNTMVGAEAGQTIRSGNLNTMAGYRSGRASFRGNENTYFGAYAGYSNSYGDGNAFVGYKAGEYLGYGNFNVAVGAYALQKATFGSCNIAIGAFAGSVITGSGNVFVGTGAGGSNTFGDNNTNVGNNAGFYGTGSENVYIGKDAALSLFGDQNVVIGVKAYPESQSSGSVVIGHHAASTIFKTGSCNIFIGIGADAHEENASYAIAIGSKDTRANTHCISVGETIDNGGLNSVLLGYSLYSDADQCVSIGHDVEVNSVDVFDDPLNWKFPVQITQGYKKFYLQENYSNLLYLGGVSNTDAIATIYASNLYDSGSNLLQGVLRTSDLQLRKYFDYSILYQGHLVQQGYTLSLNTPFNTYMSNNNLLTTDNFKINVVIIPDTPFVVTNGDISRNVYDIPMDISALYDTPNRMVSCNLIPTNATLLPYRFVLGKRIRIDTLDASASSSNIYSVSDTKEKYIYSNKSISLTNGRGKIDNTSTIIYYPDEITHATTNMVYQYKYYIHKEPLYGAFNSNIYLDALTTTPILYTPYPEGMYSCNDTFQLTIVNEYKNTNAANPGIHGSIPEDTNVRTLQVWFDSNQYVYMSSNIYLHPTTKTYIDRSYLNILPYPPKETSPLSFLQMDPNLQLTYQGTSYTNTGIGTLTIPYDTFTTTPFTLDVIHKNTDVLQPFGIQFKNKPYYYQCIYSSNVNYSNLQSNLFIPLNTFSMQTVSLPYTTKEYTYITDYPKYGTVGIPTSLSYPITYTPFTYNFGDDQFTVITGDSIANYTYLTVNLRTTSNHFHSLVLNKMQEPVQTSVPVYTYSNYHTDSQSGLYLYTAYRITQTTTGVSPWGVPDTDVSYQQVDLYPYVSADGGYHYQSNISVNSNYTAQVWTDIKDAYPDIPNPTTIPGPLGGRDYIIYAPNPKSTYQKYKWDYSLSTKAATPYVNLSNVIPAPSYYTVNNGSSLNRYYSVQYEVMYQEIYKYGCNLAIYHSNEFIWHDTYYDLYNTYIYTSNYAVPFQNLRTSNIEYLVDTIGTPTYSQVDHYIHTERYITSNIPTIQLQDTMTYDYQGYYRRSASTSNNLQFLQKDKGVVTEFYQSNITRQEIHIWNNQDSATFTHYIQNSNVYFENEKHIEIQYFKNDTTTQPLEDTTGANEITFNNGTTENSFNFPYAQTEGFTYIAIQHTCNVAFIYSDGSKQPSLVYSNPGGIKAIIGTGFSNNSFVDYINYGKFGEGGNDTRKPIRRMIPTTYYIHNTVYLNTGIHNSQTYLTSNELLYMRYTYRAEDIYYKILTIGNNLFLYKNTTLQSVGDRFTQADVNNLQMTIKGNFLGTQNITMDIEDINHTTFKTNQTLPVQKYIKHQYLPASYSNSTCNVLLQTNSLYQHQLLGSLWNHIASNVSLNENVGPIQFQLTKNPSYGFLYSSNLALFQGSNMIHSFSYDALRTHKILYIPYQPMSLSNDTIEGFFSLCNILSPVYTIPLKNYWTKWSQRVLPVNNLDFLQPGVYDTSGVYGYYTSNLYRSEGMKQDGINWSPSYISIPGLSLSAPNLNVSVSPTITLNYQNISETLHVIAEPISQRPYFRTSNITLNVDIANYTYMTPLLDTLWKPSQEVQFFIASAPTSGIILTQTTPNQFTSSPYFSSLDIQNKKVFYQHDGSSNVSSDQFTLRVGTHPYDLSSNILTVNLRVLPTPKLLTNNYDYIYYSNISTGQSNYNLLDKTRLELSTGSLYIYEQSNIGIYKKQGSTYSPVQLITKQDIDSNLIYYRPTAEFFQYGSNANKELSFKFITNSNTTITEPNKLSVFPIYTNNYQQQWFSKYNTFDSVSEILGYINSNQEITYTRFVNTTSNLSFTNKKCKIQFDYLPYQASLINTQNQNAKVFGEKYLQFLRTYKYRYELIDTHNYSFFRIDFTNTAVRVYTSNVLQLEITASNEINTTNSLFNFSTTSDWNTFYMVNQDDQNNRNLSIYMNDKNYTDYTKTPHIIPSLSLENLKQIKISVPIYDPSNYYNYTLTSNIGPGSILYYNLVNYNTQLRFRNFKILLGTYDLGTSTQGASVDGDLYNIVIGDQLKINGFNNICLGKNFSTTGTGSIILGSDIGIQLDETGQPRGTFNEIFNSIVISTSSFINSKVRDVIAIGNNVFNNVGGNLDDFLAKKPVLVGNNIDETKIDFHINFQNTFLKTTVGYPQIYCGVEGEPVCIGYNGNQQFSNTSEYKLYVNGGIHVTGPIIYSNGTNTFSKKTIFGNILFTSGTSHRCKVRIHWTQVQTSVYTAFSVHVKFNLMHNNSSYAYRKFEIWMTPVYNEIANTPNALSDVEINSFSTADITNLEHYVEREANETSSVNLYIVWDTLDTLSNTDYIMGTMEIEAVAPTALGNIYFDTPISA